MGLIENILHNFSGLFGGKKKREKAESTGAKKQAPADSKARSMPEPKAAVNAPAVPKIEEKLLPAPGKNAVSAQKKTPAKKRARKRKSAVKSGKDSGEKDYRKEIRDLKREIKLLKEKIEGKDIAPKKALGSIQVVYNEIKHEDRNIDKELEQTKHLMDFLEKDFLRRKISESMFREKMFDYREKLHILSLEKKELGKQKRTLRTTSKKVPQAVPFTLEQLSGTKNVAELLEKQQKTLEKIAEQGAVNQGQAFSANSVQKKARDDSNSTAKTVVSVPKAGEKPKPKEEVKAVKRAFASAPDSEKINSLLREKAEGRIDDAKLRELEVKVSELMKRHRVSNAEIERKLEDVTPEDLAASIDKLANLSEIEKKAVVVKKESEKESEKESAISAMRATAPMKKIEEVKGIATEIKKHRIVTDFDKVLTYIAKKGSAKIGEISKDLGIPRKRTEECCDLLRKEGQVSLVFPPIGDAVVQTKDYEQRMEIEKLRKKEEKQKQKDNSKAAKAAAGGGKNG